MTRCAFSFSINLPKDTYFHPQGNVRLRRVCRSSAQDSVEYRVENRRSIPEFDARRARFRTEAACFVRSQSISPFHYGMIDRPCVLVGVLLMQGAVPKLRLEVSGSNEGNQLLHIAHLTPELCIIETRPKFRYVGLDSRVFTCLINTRSSQTNYSLFSSTAFGPNNTTSPWLAGLRLDSFAGPSVGAQVSQAAHSIGAGIVSSSATATGSSGDPAQPGFVAFTDQTMIDEAHRLGMTIKPWTVR